MQNVSRFSLKGKVAIVTGASKGIGEAIAEELGSAGASVVVSSRKEESVRAVADRFAGMGIEATGIAAHTGQPETLEVLLNKTIDLYGGVDIIVNNAAANPVMGPVEHTDGWAFDKIMEINVKGPFELAKMALPYLKKRGGGSVINISSIGGLSPEPQLGIYSVSKAALISLTQVMAREWAQYGVRANVICPGIIQTKFSEPLWNNEHTLKFMLRQIPMGRIGQPEEIAGLALFLASEAGSYCTGGVYVADGGYTI